MSGSATRSSANNNKITKIAHVQVKTLENFDSIQLKKKKNPKN